MPTALELSREEWKPYIEAASRREDLPVRTPEERQERQRLLARIRVAAAMLKRQYDVRRVVLFGSLAHAAWFIDDSDVDLAIEGLASEDYWRAWRMVEEIIEDRPVDLVEIVVVGDSLRRAIERYGIEL